MKIWISNFSNRFVWVTPNPKIDTAGLFICRKHMARLLRGTEKKLPKHGSDEVVEVELTAK